MVNDEFEKELHKQTSSTQSIELFRVILKESLKHRNTSVQNDLDKLQKDILRHEQRLKNAKEMVLDGEITATDYKEMKFEVESALERLIADRTKLLHGLENHDTLVDEGLSLIGEIENCYKTKDTVAKQRIVSSIFAEKLVFDKSGYRTRKTINTIRLINRIPEGSGGNEKGKTLQLVKSSLEVVPKGFKPLTF